MSFLVKSVVKTHCGDQFYNAVMNFRSFIRQLLAFLPVLFIAKTADATTFFFPDMNPSFVRSEAPKWLKEGKGNDGYVTITSEVIPTSACTQMSSSGFWSSDKTQLVLSVVTNGFKTKLDKAEIPIATFDGRENGSQCASLSSTPLQIVPLANLGAYSIFNPGNLSLVLNVKSSNDTKKDFVGSAKLILGTASIIATGGYAAAIGGVTSTLGTSVVSDTQEKANNLLKGMVDAKVPISVNWTELRNGLQAVELFVYKSNESLGDISDKKIKQLQEDPNADKQLLFTVKLEFLFSRTIFYPATSNIEGLVSRENLSPQYILNFQVPGTRQNFIQLLNSSSPSLLLKISKAEGQDLTRTCSSTFEKLKAVGLDGVDIAIVTKAFLDEAKGDDGWYSNPALVKSCFSQMPSVQSYLEQIYGAPASLKSEQ